MSRGKYGKAVLAGIGTGLCLTSLITIIVLTNNNNRGQLWTNSLIVGVVALGVGCGLCTGCVVQDREDSRRYQQLYKDDNKRIGMLSGDKKLDPELKLAIQRNLEHNLKEESELLDVPNGDSTTHSLLKEFRLIKLSIANIEKSI